jgi:hypothetical protein
MELVLLTESRKDGKKERWKERKRSRREGGIGGRSEGVKDRMTEGTAESP